MSRRTRTPGSWPSDHRHNIKSAVNANLGGLLMALLIICAGGIIAIIYAGMLYLAKAL